MSATFPIRPRQPGHLVLAVRQLRTRGLAVIAAIALGLAAADLAAQAWPQRPVRIIVPYAPGGNTDAIARVTAERLGSALGQQFVVENRGGAGGATAAEFVAKSPPDGYTLFVAALSQFGPVPLTQKVNYDPLADFTPISNIGANGFVIAVNPGMPVKDLKEFVDYAKARPGRLNYGSGGTGSMTHLAPLLFLKRAGIDMVHVAYKGGAPALADTLSGQVQMYAGSPSELLQHAAAGKIRLLGISSAKRNAQLPDVPAIAESYPGFKAETWNGLVGPAGLPPPIVERLATEMTKLMKDPAFLERLGKLGLEPVVTTPTSFGADIRAEHAMWRELIKSSGVVVD
jgi:tripartite-type tricarboxylate transporter receptor subunit TctC